MKYKWDLITDLEILSKDVPVVWDRVITSEQSIFFFGFIKNKKKNKRDFVLLQYFFLKEFSFRVITTSSPKYSKKLSENNLRIDNREFNEEVDHFPCLRFEDFFHFKLLQNSELKVGR